jgi:hypothetical protein
MIALYILAFVIISILLSLFMSKVFFKISKITPVECCKECYALKENNYCIILKETIKDINKLSCVRK